MGAQDRSTDVVGNYQNTGSGLTITSYGLPLYLYQVPTYLVGVICSHCIFALLGHIRSYFYA